MGQKKRMATHRCGSKMCWGIAMGICLLIGIVFIITGPVLWAQCGTAKSDCDDACGSCPTGCWDDQDCSFFASIATKSTAACKSKMCDLKDACTWQDAWRPRDDHYGNHFPHSWL